jgi:hypothetical protein
MYHCTKRKHLSGILKHGLLPRKPKWIKKPIKGVYLSVKPFDWMHSATNESTVAGAMIVVDVTGLKLIKDESLFEARDNNPHPAFIHTNSIQPSRFIRISVSTDRNPTFFDDVTDIVLKK